MNRSIIIAAFMISAAILVTGFLERRAHVGSTVSAVVTPTAAPAQTKENANQNVSRFEQAVLDWFCRHADQGLASLVRACRVVERRHTGVGLYLELESDTPGPSTSLASPVSGPDFDSPEIPYGGGSLLFLENGKPVMLEIYTHSSYPEQGPEQFTLKDANR